MFHSWHHFCSKAVHLWFKWIELQHKRFNANIDSVGRFLKRGGAATASGELLAQLPTHRPGSLSGRSANRLSVV